MSLNIHVSTTTDPAGRGREIGSRWRDRIQATARDYDWLFQAAGLDEPAVRRIAGECLDALHTWEPELATEIRGIAAGAGLPTWRAAALTARTEILVRGKIAGLKECTTAALAVPDRPPRVLQTWDWIPQAENFTILRYTSTAGLGVVTFAENGVVGKVGVNSAGLGVLFTLLCHSSDGTTTGVPVHAVVRRVLDNATTVAQAIETARSAPVTASAALTVVTWNGGRCDAAVVELSPAGSAELRPVGDGYLLHTNHFLDPELATGDRLVAVGDDTVPRLAALRRLSTALTGADRTAWARGLVSHWEDGAPICAHPRADADVTNRWETKMMLTFDLTRPSLIVQEGKPCQVTESRWLEFAA
ncbi:isopenicillin-N N-acyltransferase-like protein [Kribbella aluminosa]|uniref:Isopenicillin-N N-acyltransferase-like protein n=1 Tax=Kribbella aluminosa TaxID=416017 RepID=A0ABS4UKC0_9ACTN|nr:C45 family peptidase [Kribbella aluminosa]MBP2351986.1 isopenicillin-N N-acyltransferase-like protein [Kribbella aluminosa]